MSNHDGEILAKRKEMHSGYEELKRNREPVGKDETFMLAHIPIHKDDKQLQVETGKEEYTIGTLEGQGEYVKVKARQSEPESQKGESK